MRIRDTAGDGDQTALPQFLCFCVPPRPCQANPKWRQNWLGAHSLCEKEAGWYGGDGDVPKHSFARVCIFCVIIEIVVGVILRYYVVNA